MAGKNNKREEFVAETAKSYGFEVLGRGWPDFLIYDDARNKAMFLEVKSKQDQIRPEQKQMHKILRRLGLDVKVIRIGADQGGEARLHEILSCFSDKIQKELSGKTIELTSSLLLAGKSSNGGWSKQQLELFDVHYPLQKGWFKRLIGELVPVEYYEEFLKLKNKHLK